jgi:hypothetical protein
MLLFYGERAVHLSRRHIRRGKPAKYRLAD